jgi:hypothetical protein
MATKKEAVTETAVLPAAKPAEVVSAEEMNEALAPQLSMEEQMEQDERAGYEGVGAGDRALPFITIIQALSPQIKRSNAKFIPEAAEGMLFDTVSNVVYDGQTGIDFIPCGVVTTLVEWKDRDKGTGGFVGQIAANDPRVKTAVKDDKGRLITKDGNVIVDTAYHLGVHLSGENKNEPRLAVIPMSSSQRGKSRRWITQMESLRLPKKSGVGTYVPPMYSQVFRIGTKPEQSKKGQDYFGYELTFLRTLSSSVEGDPQLYAICRQLSEQIASKQIQVSAPPQESEETTEVPF